MLPSAISVRFRLALQLALLFSAAAPSFAQDSALRDSFDSRREMSIEGRLVFNKFCTACHGIDGVAGDRAPAMAAQRRYLHRTPQALFDAIQAGIPGSGMPPMNLDDTDAWKIVSWIRTMRAKAIDVPVEGDRSRGEDVFWGQGGCGDCHTIRGRGGLRGPDLSNLGSQMSLKKIQESLTVAKLRPSLGYRPVTVTTKDGRKVSGVSKNEHNFSLQMIGDDNRLHLFAAGQVETIVFGEKPLMPADYDQRLSTDEFQNLIAFLSRLSLRPPEAAAREPARERGARRRP